MAVKPKPFRATPDRWTFRIVVNDGETRLESSGPIDPDLGDVLRTFQIAFSSLTAEERSILLMLRESIQARLRKR